MSYLPQSNLNRPKPKTPKKSPKPTSNNKDTDGSFISSFFSNSNKKNSSAQNKKPKSFISILTKEERKVYLMLMVVMIVALGSVVYKYSDVYGISAKIQKAQREINVEVASHNEIKKQILTLQSTDRIQHEAARLGLRETTKEDKTLIVDKDKKSVRETSQ